ncbi:MAG: type I 3-dehydroquinate dehydratase [Candidatus Methanoplasma sp.]|jgi:3-dehydroquinate dehydratase/shikimate dehydrogenase|nr:type I 3-dehydroquinate dehydratase [Candidatus Methanoplasma sp.]
MMKICASLSSFSDTELIGKADMAEIRTDILDHVPDVPGKDLLVTFRGVPDLSILPKGFSGMIDIGENAVPDTDITTISSCHNYELTPPAEEIADLLGKMKGDISKGAFKVNSFSDLRSIFDASVRTRKKHVLLGMGGLGTVTRIRQDALGNEFTFAYAGEPTAPGQLSLDEMSCLGEHPMITGILGHPLDKSMSPRMHNAAMKKAAINGIYLKFDTCDLRHLGDAVRDYDIRGLNVTIPHKSEILEHLDCFDEDVRAIGAANTIFNSDGILRGYNTDIIGIEWAMKQAGFNPDGRKALIMGSGGAARACAYILGKRGCCVTVTGRNEDTSRSLCRDLGCRCLPKDSASVPGYDLIVNCTPVGMYGSGEYPADICRLTGHQSVFDMVYGTETHLMSKAKEAGARIISGEDMLAMQGAASLEIWADKKDLFGYMKEALL